jgi:SWI/SNF-related matrix-associated actin-dependent regulator of chromatin subfamily A member 5
LEDYCYFREYKYVKIDGNSSLDQRDEATKKFDKDPSVRIFLISTRAGGIGLNLTSADIVILYDIDWNPQMDRQAMDRSYRIGQKNNVLVFRIISNNTI